MNVMIHICCYSLRCSSSGGAFGSSCGDDDSGGKEMGTAVDAVIVTAEVRGIAALRATVVAMSAATVMALAAVCVCVSGLRLKGGEL
jgi:hypothetical protein